MADRIIFGRVELGGIFRSEILGLLDMHRFSHGRSMREIIDGKFLEGCFGVGLVRAL